MIDRDHQGRGSVAPVFNEFHPYTDIKLVILSPGPTSYKRTILDKKTIHINTRNWWRPFAFLEKNTEPVLT